MSNSWWHKDPEDEDIRYFEIEQDEFMDACLDFDLIFGELEIQNNRLDIDDIIDWWFYTNKF